jgi:hypothetical protein
MPNPLSALFLTGVSAFFESSTYSVMESNQSIQVCIVLSGLFERAVTFQASTSPLSALPGIMNDYMSFSQTLATMTSEICIDIDINLDAVVEDTEMFQINLGSAGDAAVMISQAITDVLILDSSVANFLFSLSVYTVFENSSIFVCAILEGATVRSIDITLQVNSTGTYEVELLVKVYCMVVCNEGPALYTKGCSHATPPPPPLQQVQSKS